MSLFTTRDRWAILTLSVLIIAGWAVRYGVSRSQSPHELRVIHNAVPMPQELIAPEVTSPRLININTATASDFETLPGIGPAKAAAIVQFRSQHGPFGKTSELVKVPGIGPATLEQMRPLITVADSTNSHSASKTSQ